MNDSKGNYDNVYRRLDEDGEVNKIIVTQSAFAVHASAPPCVQPAVCPPGYPAVHSSGDTPGYPPTHHAVTQDVIITSPENVAPKLFDCPESQLEFSQVPGFDFSEKSIRRSFIRKVYSVLMCQLLVTLAIITLFVYCSPVKLWMRGLTIRSLKLLLFSSMGLIGFVFLIMLLCDEVRRRAPMNFIFLGVFTVLQSLMIGMMTSFLEKSEVVLVAFGITAAICLALTLYAFQTKTDFTVLGGGLLAVLLVFALFGLLAGLLPRYRTLNMIYAGIGVLIFSVYIIYDTQLMMNGGHKYAVSPEEYIFAALNLYLDIINLFIYVLRLMASR